MSALVIKNLPDTLHRRLKARAERNHRSLTKEAIAIIEAGLEGAPSMPAPQGSPLDALAAAGNALIAQGIDVKEWGARSREAWR
jgi:plasmid stability protein